jgi:RHS repeat-associated protein
MGYHECSFQHTYGNFRLAGPKQWAQYNASNQMSATNQNPNQGQNYDAEGRVCAVQYTVSGTTIMTGYIYNAEGQRVSKGSISGWSCDPLTNDFRVSTDYYIGPNGQQLTELVPNGRGGMSAQRTYVYADGELMADIDPDGVHFRLTDWLGTLRATTNYAGERQSTYLSLPFGEQLGATGNTTDPHHFTGKERDQESGNDYFGARYYASSMGRFLSPDWSASISPIPYAKLSDPQSLNLYSYVRNSPLTSTDPDGHCGSALSSWLEKVGYYALAATASCDPDAWANFVNGHPKAQQQNNQQQEQPHGIVNYHGHKVSDPRVRNALDQLSEKMGLKIDVISGDRNYIPRGGALHSYHLRGQAADFHADGASDSSVIEYLKENSLPAFEGINVIQHGPYSQTEGPHIHIDSRNDPGTPTTFMHEGMTEGSRGYIIDTP